MNYVLIEFTHPAEFAQEAYMAWEGDSAVTFYDLDGNVIIPPEVHEVITLDNTPEKPSWAV